MGIKKFKEKYKIDHIVQLSDNGYLIGSGYIQNLALIHFDGTIVSSSTSPHFIKDYYPHLLLASKEEILSVLNEPDVFEKSIPVFSYNDDGLIEDFCEEFGWPRITHSGKIMNSNWYKSKDVALKTGREYYLSAILYHRKNIEELELKIEKEKDQIDGLFEILKKFK